VIRHSTFGKRAKPVTGHKSGRSEVAYFHSLEPPAGAHGVGDAGPSTKKA
jgi:hypothetical protein